MELHFGKGGKQKKGVHIFVLKKHLSESDTSHSLQKWEAFWFHPSVSKTCWLPTRHNPSPMQVHLEAPWK